MIKEGFTALKPWYESRLWACSSDEVESFKCYEIEEKKENLGDPRPFGQSIIFDTAIGYKSPFLDALRMERDRALGMSALQARSSGVEEWRLEIHPVKQRLVRENSADRFSRAQQQVAMRELERQGEIARFRSGKASAYKNPGVLHKDQFAELVNISKLKFRATESLEKLHFDDLQKFYVEIVEIAFSKIGFEYSHTHSTPTYPAFSKQLNDSWSIVFSNERFSNENLVNSFDAVSLCFSLRNKKAKGPLAKKSETNFLILKIHLLAYGLDAWYRKFTSLDELEVIVKAYACLYEQIQFELECRLLP